MGIVYTIFFSIFIPIYLFQWLSSGVSGAIIDHEWEISRKQLYEFHRRSV